MIGADLITDTAGDLDLDFHAIMHWGEDAALEKHYVPTRSQRTKSVLSFFAQDGASQTLIYANADLTKATQANEVLVFAEHWKTLTGSWPNRLVMDQKVTNQTRARRTRRPRHHLAHPADALTRPEPPHRRAARHRLAQPCAWTATATTDGPASSTNTPPCPPTPHPVRQLIVTGLGRDAATVLITNDRTATTKQLIERYARRMNIEQRLAESIRSFHTDALAGSVPLNVDLDVALSVLAGAVCAALRRRLTGYHHATPDTLQRRFLSTGGTITNHGDTITVRLNRRTYSPVLRQADIPDTTIPWWGDAPCTSNNDDRLGSDSLRENRR